jgi:quercetin dioxygenase-like cupin family protein
VTSDPAAFGHGNSATEAIVVTSTLDLVPEQSRQEIYSPPIGVRLLYQYPASGAEHYLIRYPRGLTARLHRHTAAHTIIVLEGELLANGHRVGPGGYCHFPAGVPMHHAPPPGLGCAFVTAALAVTNPGGAGSIRHATS